MNSQPAKKYFKIVLGLFAAYVVVNFIAGFILGFTDNGSCLFC